MGVKQQPHRANNTGMGGRAPYKDAADEEEVMYAVKRLKFKQRLEMADNRRAAALVEAKSKITLPRSRFLDEDGPDMKRA